MQGLTSESGSLPAKYKSPLARMGSAASTEGSTATPFPQDPSADETVQPKEPMGASFAADRLKQPDASDVQTLDQAATELERYAHLLPLFREGLLRAAKGEITRARKMVRERTQKGPGEAELLAAAGQRCHGTTSTRLPI